MPNLYLSFKCQSDVRVLCMRYCNGFIAYILLHYLMKFHLEITKDKEMTTFLYVLSDHPTYMAKIPHTKIKISLELAVLKVI